LSGVQTGDSIVALLLEIVVFADANLEASFVARFLAASFCAACWRGRVRRPSATPGGNLFAPLLQYDKTLRPIGGVAESWQVSSDGRRYRFQLNDRARFSDGTAVRASDVVFTLRKVADPASGSIQTSSSFELLDLSQTRAVADRTVEVAFKEPLATQLTSFTDLFVLPEHVYGKGDFRSNFSDRAVGSGPYRFVRREVGKTITLERRAEYWSARPHIQTVVFKVISDHNTAWNALQRGAIDETLITSDRWSRVHDDPALNRTIDFRRFRREAKMWFSTPAAKLMA
jgi:peptide/nickel transport system substrate-binding protein